MRRLAVVGGGPKALFALLALHDRVAPGAALLVDVYDPLPPGAGSVWRAGQPATLRLNVPAGIVDASSSLSGERFGDWVARERPALVGEPFPPRVVVGEYLRAQFQLLQQQGAFPVRHVPFAVDAVVRTARGWDVSSSSQRLPYDEVLLATGHGLATGPALNGAVNARPLIGDYPGLDAATLPAGGEVWVRGAALTAYDVALLLTEGRGGRWRDDGGSLRYLPSGREPRSITLSSRRGRLMVPKTPRLPAGLAPVLEAHRLRLRRWGEQQRALPPGTAGSFDGLWAILLDCAEAAGVACDAPVSALALWRTALTGISSRPPGAGAMGPAGAEPGEAAAFLREALAVNAGRAPLTTGWLWARTWSGLYAELVSALDRLPRSTADAARFRRVAAHLERFAFGPPEPTARKLLALMEAGLLHVGTAAVPEGAALVDAVTPAPGALPPAGGTVLAGLLRQGLATVRPGDRGLLTDPDGTCLTPAGRRSETLAVVGRPTEDPTLGHDTLNRALHEDHLLWAARVAARALAPLQR